MRPRMRMRACPAPALAPRAPRLPLLAAALVVAACRQCADAPAGGIGSECRAFLALHPRRQSSLRRHPAKPAPSNADPADPPPPPLPACLPADPARNGTRPLPGKKAMLALGGGWQADMRFADWAYEAVAGSARQNVSVSVLAQGARTAVNLLFPAANSTYYDTDGRERDQHGPRGPSTTCGHDISVHRHHVRPAGHALKCGGRAEALIGAGAGGRAAAGRAAACVVGLPGPSPVGWLDAPQPGQPPGGAGRRLPSASDSSRPV